MARYDRFNTGEVDLSYTEWPGDAPPVLALHGISSTRANDLARALEGRHAFAYDHRGHGESGRTPGAYTFVNYGRDAIAFLRGVVREPAVLVGHSLGGMAAIYAAAQAPELIRAAFLVDPPLYAPEVPLRDEREPFARVAEQAGRPVEELEREGVPPLRAEMVSRLDPAVMRMTLDGSAFEGWDTDAYLRAIQCPVLLEHGDRERGSVIYPGEVERAMMHLRDATVLHLDGTGHVPWADQRERFFQLLADFIAQA